ncbi:hypothetical protein DUNSADRAFT_3467 [Dunaliella salina]|uniref:Uncharacterized protein n=1 Tax=Dunaliella salina TaxID=3046 RepID=A0ABQ7GTU8_DUNSA|nr:hypothetical protein DUNSADRAFT_3467 [Dunaliella salina]|eukprot:KAF5838033.1 hypothetical protein DUNSADRAFT_3467 [Dunaliella salina]
MMNDSSLSVCGPRLGYAFSTLQWSITTFLQKTILLCLSSFCHHLQRTCLGLQSTCFMEMQDPVMLAWITAVSRCLDSNLKSAPSLAPLRI